MSAAKRAVVTMVGDREMTAMREFDAPRARVWKAMTTPELVAKWWGRGNPLDVVTYDFVRGGHWRFVEHAHGEKHGFEGRFSEITPIERVVQTFEWDGMPGHVALETMTLEELPGGRTRLRTHSIFMTAVDRDGMAQSGMEDGMNQSYDALDRVLAGL